MVKKGEKILRNFFLMLRVRRPLFTRFIQSVELMLKQNLKKRIFFAHSYKVKLLRWKKKLFPSNVSYECQITLSS
jgi:hypothetical protein